jgi:CMP-N-acetylneuraminic acid synthetase
MFDNKKILAIIPARGESKGIPKKNIKLLAGKPLIAYTIEEALRSKYLDRVIVSTDDEEIVNIAKKYGAEVPFLRPKELAKDDSSSLSALLHALNYIGNEEKYFPEIIVFLQPTSPFRTSKHIDEGIKLLMNSSVDSVVGVCKVEGENHPYFMYTKDDNDVLEEIIKIKNKPLRRQELPVFFRFNDALFISRRKYFDHINLNAMCFNPDNMKGLVMDRISSVDINNEFDFLLAEFISSSKLFFKK